MKKSRKLSWKEIENTIDKIKRKYNDLIIQYMLPVDLIKEFEDRYFEALRIRMDMDVFLKLEISALSDLKKEEDIKLAASRKYAAQKDASRDRNDSAENFADRIIRENRERIKKYPEFSICKDASEEIQRLYSVLVRFDKEYWPVVDKILRDIQPSSFSGARFALESKVFELCSINVDGFAPALSRYRSLLLRIPRDYSIIEVEEKRFLLESAFMFHEIKDELNRFLKKDWIDPENKSQIEKVLTFINPVIKDFRLTDLKPGKTKGY